MKRHSLKFKIALWFTGILLGISIIMLSMFFIVNQISMSRSLQRTLIDTVQREAVYLQTDRGHLEHLFENKADIREAEFFVDDVMLTIADEHGRPIAGFSVYTDLGELTYQETLKARMIHIRDRTYYCYDRHVRGRPGTNAWVRGIVPADNTLFHFAGHFVSFIFLIPLLLLLAFAGGYMLTGNFLRPVERITRTAEEIRQSGDLSKRIEVGDAGDELADLAGVFNAMFEKLEEDFDMQRQFTSNASHELRTPISVILAQCEYGFDNAGDADALLETIAAVQKQGYKMSGLVETLLLFTRMEQNSDRYAMQTVNISELIRSSCEDNRIIAPKNISISEDIEDDVVIQANTELFRLMVNNLIANALRYGRDNGHVHVSLKKTEETLELLVEDDGIGIKEKDREMIFQRFYRSEASRSSKGLGLGLSLVKQIAEYHNGSVSVESEWNKGSKFYVFLTLF